MRRSLSRVLCLVGGLLAAAGCVDQGSYSFSWEFVGGERAEDGCGLHGVDSLRVTGMNQEGEGDAATALCAEGQFARSVPVGSWTFTVRQIDARGVPIELKDAQGALLPDPTATANVVKDVNTELEPIVLEVRPACGDRVDNDRDGRVDLDDPECDGSEDATEDPIAE